MTTTNKIRDRNAATKIAPTRRPRDPALAAAATGLALRPLTNFDLQSLCCCPERFHWDNKLQSSQYDQESLHLLQRVSTSKNFDISFIVYPVFEDLEAYEQARSWHNNWMIYRSQATILIMKMGAISRNSLCRKTLDSHFTSFQDCAPDLNPKPHHGNLERVWLGGLTNKRTSPASGQPRFRNGPQTSQHLHCAIHRFDFRQFANSRHWTSSYGIEQKFRVQKAASTPRSATRATPEAGGTPD